MLMLLVLRVARNITQRRQETFHVLDKKIKSRSLCVLKCEKHVNIEQSHNCWSEGGNCAFKRFV